MSSPDAQQRSVLHEIFVDIPRQGPGDAQSTRRAFSMLEHLPQDPVISWLASDVPEAPKRFWEEDYPAITTVKENIDTIERAGYTMIGHFVLPESAWWDDYYVPIEKRLIDLRNKYQDSAAAKASVESMQQEIDLYRQYSAYYGYVFYIARKKD